MNTLDALLQGTTPRLTITIPDSIPVSEISALELSLTHKEQTTLLHLPDVDLDVEENVIIKRFSEAETLAMDPDYDLTWQLRVKVNNEIVGTQKSRIDIIDLQSEEPIE